MALRPWRAFLLAPLAAPIAYWIDLLVEAAADPARRPFLTHGGVDALAISILIGGPIAYAATAIVGIPLWLGRRERGLPIGAAVAAGALAGAVTALLLAPSLRSELFSIPLGAWRGGALGLITSAIWWYLLQPAARAASIERT